MKPMRLLFKNFPCPFWKQTKLAVYSNTEIISLPEQYVILTEKNVRKTE